MPSNTNIGGNYYPKYNTSNPVARWLVANFIQNFRELAALSDASHCFEAGCGEGHLTDILDDLGIKVRGIDISEDAIAEAQNRRAVKQGKAILSQGDIFQLQAEESSELVVCCEVLEHLDDPHAALEILTTLANPWLLLSVPREPLWRILNMARLKYLTQLGNTPGHLQHWSQSSFISMVSQYAEIYEVRTPLPWTMVLCRTN